MAELDRGVLYFANGMESSDQPLSEDVTHFSGCCSSPFLLRSQLSNFCQRVGETKFSTAREQLVAVTSACGAFKGCLGCISTASGSNATTSVTICSATPTCGIASTLSIPSSCVCASSMLLFIIRSRRQPVNRGPGND
ncbi:hypothetical protein IFM89_022597 [Coptis chinensis]|uniref:Uncharacterized protein n=1 Tax=Coptis chinensis TaxID=261450 RepID=A0A835IC43_9MAGN|nr:hypothetical protein IFM89_022597 [Coptis chinensis]